MSIQVTCMCDFKKCTGTLHFTRYLRRLSDMFNSLEQVLEPILPNSFYSWMHQLSIFHYWAWPSHSRNIFFLFYNTYSSLSTRIVKKQKQSLVGLNFKARGFAITSTIVLPHSINKRYIFSMKLWDISLKRTDNKLLPKEQN